jgi:hypothetical protein
MAGMFDIQSQIEYFSTYSDIETMLIYAEDVR